MRVRFGVEPDSFSVIKSVLTTYTTFPKLDASPVGYSCMLAEPNLCLQAGKAW